MCTVNQGGVHNLNVTHRERHGGWRPEILNSEMTCDSHCVIVPAWETIWTPNCSPAMPGSRVDDRLSQACAQRPRWCSSSMYRPPSTWAGKSTTHAWVLSPLGYQYGQTSSVRGASEQRGEEGGTVCSESSVTFH